MKTEIVRTDSEAGCTDAVRRAVEALQAGEPVALPTETVYGLAADALNPAAVEKIFVAKQRPHFDPLIVHVHHRGAVGELAQLPEAAHSIVNDLLEAFWPGPLTLVLPRKPVIPDLVTGGLGTVALRQSAHPVFQRVIEAFGGPLAAPSANRFGRMSPTSAEAVLDQLDGRIPLVVDGGACARGLESTIIKVEAGGTPPVITVLRPGPVTEQDLRAFGTVQFAVRNAEVEDAAPEAPGMLAHHYAPRTPLRLLEPGASFRAEPGKRYALLSFRGTAKDGYLGEHPWVHVAVLSPETGTLEEAGTRFFHLLRELDRLQVDEIIAEPLPDEGVGKALLDKLRKAALK